jgi:hypothetical protein
VRSRSPEAPTPRCSRPAHGPSTGRRCAPPWAASTGPAAKPPPVGTATSTARSDPARPPPQPWRPDRQTPSRVERPGDSNHHRVRQCRPPPVLTRNPMRKPARRSITHDPRARRTPHRRPTAPIASLGSCRRRPYSHAADRAVCVRLAVWRTRRGAGPGMIMSAGVPLARLPPDALMRGTATRPGSARPAPCGSARRFGWPAAAPTGGRRNGRS